MDGSYLSAGCRWDVRLGAVDGGSRGMPEPGFASTAQQIVDTWRDDYNGGDATGVAGLYEPDAYYLTQHFATGVLHGRDAIRAYVKRGVDAGYKIDSLFILAFGCSGEMMYVVTRYNATNAGQKVFGVNLVVLKQEGSKWLIAAHEAAVPDPTAIQDLELPTVSAQATPR